MRWMSLSRVASFGVGVLLLLGFPLPSALGQQLDDAAIFAIGPDLNEETNWSFSITLQGSADLTSATVTVPNGSSTELVLGCGPCGSGVDCLFEEGFASLPELLQSYPAGNYQLSINDGARTAMLPFAPSDPQGTVTITAPPNGQTGVSATPTVQYENSCSSCDLLLFGLFSFTFENTVDLDFETEDLSSPGSIPYAAWQENPASCETPPKPAALPEDPYVVVASAVKGSVTTESFDQGTGLAFEFEYRAGAARGSTAMFEVPEPSGDLPALTALVSLSALAIRRSRARHMLRT